jgi:hypothetical protein
MKSNKTNPDSTRDKIQKKINCILNNRAKSSQSSIDRIPKQTPAHYVLKNCRADAKSKKN